MTGIRLTSLLLGLLVFIFLKSYDVQGSYGVINLVEDKNTKKQFALKRVLFQDIEQILKHKKEFELSYLLNHSNLIKIHNVLFKYLDLTTYALYVLMEKAETDWNTEIEKRKISQNFYT